MEKTAVLCHINKSTLQLWENSIGGNQPFIPAEKAKNLLQNFIDFLSSCKCEIFLSFELSGIVADEIRQKSGNHFSELPFSHELALLKHIFQNQNISYVYYMDSVYGIVDTTLTEKLYQIHNEYSADYSFVENGPPGITGVFFNRSLFEALEIEQNEKSTAPEIDNAAPDSMAIPLSGYLEKNINHFHVEIHYEHPDLRLLRLDYSGKSARSILNTTHVFDACSKSDNYYAELEGLYSQNPGLLHHFPSYIELEIYGGCEYKCTFCPRQFAAPPDGQMLSVTGIKSILAFASTGLNDTSFCLGGQGEPLEHPEIREILNLLLSEKSVPVVILETNGKYLDKIFPLIDHTEFRKLKTVININSLKNYESLHGTNILN
ncbi:MAG: radical SAM protein, partial [Spirochaetia bacterium]|nr:radical SAM protein [Spirochaetia bacterium]